MNTNKTQSKVTLDEQSSEGPRCQETMGEGDVSSRQETLLNIPMIHQVW